VSGKILCRESSEELWKHIGALQLGLEVAGAGLNDDVRIEAKRSE
jgi:hypothetical protein